MKTTKILLFGLGYIGRMVLEAILSENPFWNQKLELVGAIDIVPESREWSKKKGIPAFQSLEEFIKKGSKADVCIHTTASNMSVVVAQLKELVKAGIPVVSSTEELFFPWVQNPKVAKELDELCKNHKVAMMGTGVNPGFIMDVLPSFITQAVHTVDMIRVERIVNASTRRPTVQKKIGAGLDEATFRSNVERGKIGHVGLKESLDFIAQFMGWELTKRGENIEPILTPKALATRVVTLKKGQVCGLHHLVWGEVNRKRVIELDLKITINADAPGDIITIQGNPPMTLSIEGGTPGDPATVAALIRGIPIVIQAKPGIVRRLERDHFLNS